MYSFLSSSSSSSSPPPPPFPPLGTCWSPMNDARWRLSGIKVDGRRRRRRQLSFCQHRVPFTHNRSLPFDLADPDRPGCDAYGNPGMFLPTRPRHPCNETQTGRKLCTRPGKRRPFARLVWHVVTQTRRHRVRGSLPVQDTSTVSRNLPGKSFGVPWAGHRTLVTAAKNCKSCILWTGQAESHGTLILGGID